MGLQVCMDSSDWLQLEDATLINDENNSSSPSSGGLDMLTPQAALMMEQRRLRPPHDQALNCPRCDSTHTKFCYYNNYSLTQPRYFCKTCRRYWTKGGTLRNIPVGGGCRKNKKINPSKKINTNHQAIIITNNNHHSFNSHDFLGDQGIGGFGLLGAQETTTQMTMPIDFMECSRNNNFGMVSSATNNHANFNGINSCSPFGYSFNGMENYQRLMLPYNDQEGGGGVLLNNDQNTMDDVKPSTKLLTLDHNWQDHHSIINGYHLNGLGSSWSGLMNNGF